MTTLIADIETDGLLPELTKVHCLAIANIVAPSDVTVYADQEGYEPIAKGLARLAEADRMVFHNGLGFDLHAIHKLYGNVIDRTKVFDTLVLSRFIDPPLAGGHSLERWGERLGYPKGEYNDWSKFTEEMATYCARDVEVTCKLYNKLMSQVQDYWTDSLRLEHDFAYVMSLQEQHGFRLDVDKAVEVAAELRQEMVDIERQLQEVFPPITVERYSEKTGKRLKDKEEMFNPGSRKMIGERLIERYNWKPKKFTPTGIPQIDEVVLGGLDYPEAKLLARYFLCQKQLGQISDGESGWLKCVTKAGYVHGKVNTIGAATHRCSHFGPNMAQISKRDLRMREVWLPDEGDVLVGCDADALELRCLASYLGNFDGGEYANALLKGSKEDGTDVHSRTGKLVGLKSRDETKRLTYAFLYGASDRKLSSILREAGAAVADGKTARAKMESGINGLGKLVAIIKSRLKRGFLLGIDKRHINIKSDHSALNFLLQSCGAILMKKALQVFHYELCAEAGHVVNEKPVTFAYCANVHDEVQLSVRKDQAEEVGKLFARAIEIAGERLGMNCPTSGSYEIGSNWRETH
jgi:DNA polymerase-1